MTSSAAAEASCGPRRAASGSEPHAERRSSAIVAAITQQRPPGQRDRGDPAGRADHRERHHAAGDVGQRPPAQHERAGQADTGRGQQQVGAGRRGAPGRWCAWSSAATAVRRSAAPTARPCSTQVSSRSQRGGRGRPAPRSRRGGRGRPAQRLGADQRTSVLLGRRLRPAARAGHLRRCGGAARRTGRSRSVATSRPCAASCRPSADVERGDDGQGQRPAGRAGDPVVDAAAAAPAGAASTVA